MSENAQFRGPVEGGKGTAVPFTAGWTGASRVQDAHARYHQAVLEGRVYYMDSDSVTLAAANTTKTALGTAKFVNGFYNPVGSGKVAMVWRALTALVSGTATGPFVYNGFPLPGNITSAATGTIRSAMTMQASGSAMIPQTGVILATTPANTAALLQLGVQGGPAAIAAGAGIYSVLDELAGLYAVYPGNLFGLMQVGAGVGVAQSTLWWEEVSYVP